MSKINPPPPKKGNNMAHIGEIGKRMTIRVTFKKSYDYVDYKFSYYGTTHYIHTFEDSDGNIIVWKSTNPVETINDGKENPNRKGDVVFIPTGSIVDLTGTVKEHGMYKDTEQTVVTRCKFSLVERAKTQQEIQQERIEAQQASIGENDIIWEMPYRQYKEHYSDCETVIGSFNRHEDSHGNPHGDPTIKVIIREGRLKASGVRGQHYRGFEFTTDTGSKVCYRAISEETARKRMKKEFPTRNTESWECTKIYSYQDVHRIR
jgi:hypothetical protein